VINLITRRHARGHTHALSDWRGLTGSDEKGKGEQRLYKQVNGLCSASKVTDFKYG